MAAAAAPDLKRVTLELGGNDAAIVLDDVDPDAIADEAVLGRVRELRPGVQRDQARLRAREARTRRCVDELAARAKGVKVGDGFEDGVQLGPINNRRSSSA